MQRRAPKLKRFGSFGYHNRCIDICYYVTAFSAMPFEWDEEKRESNLAKHRVDFVDIFGIFDGQVKEMVDKRRNYRETRIRCLGEIHGRVYVVVYTWRGDNRRIRQMAEKRGRICA